MVLFDHSTSTDAKNLLLKLSETNFGIDSDYNLWIKGKSGTKCTTAENSGPGGSWIVNSKQDCSQSFWFYCEYNKFHQATTTSTPPTTTTSKPMCGMKRLSWNNKLSAFCSKQQLRRNWPQQVILCAYDESHWIFSFCNFISSTADDYASYK